MGKKDDLNIDGDWHYLELDFSNIDFENENPFKFAPIKSNLPRHIDEIIENELQSFGNSVELIASKDIRLVDEFLTVLQERVKVSIITEIKKNSKYLNGLTKKQQILAVKSIIEDYLFYVNIILALASGNIEKLLLLMKIDQGKYEKLESNHKDVNRELSIAHDKLKSIGDEKRAKRKGRQSYFRTKEEKALARVEFYEKVLPEFRREFTRNSEHTRKKNGDINFSALGRIYGVDHKTAKRWCIRYGITLKLPLR